MTKQQKTYLLMIAVIAVWGIIGYQIYSHLNPEEEELPETVFQKTSSIKKMNKELYTVQKHNRDPFLGKLANQPKKKRKATTKKKNTTPVIFPNIIYNGIVESGNTKSYIVTINSNQEFMKPNSVRNDIKLLSGTPEEITIIYKGEKKIIPLKQ
ncbi:conserved protein of unknown function [Tenacibaculum sp. 190524A02b]|uniref:hypothetical protein n=1 Tax=Tenacibaculum vairaonense TaxID=3137860 RepID=UPI0032B30EAE